MEDKEKANYENVLEYLCLELSQVLKNIPTKYKGSIEEIRLRNGMPLSIYLKGSDYFITQSGALTKNKKDSILVNSKHIVNTFHLISSYSVYAFEEEIKNGFITLKGGHRVGIGGKVLYGQRGVETIKNISSLNIRIAREKLGVSNEIIKYIIDFPKTIHNTLIISPPQCGKTTLLRDIIRNLSDGLSIFGNEGLKVGVIDERSELASVYNGVPQNNLGLRTDVLDGCNKRDGTTMLIRAMSPEVIAMDEIGSISDVEAIHEGLRAGVKIIATVHGYNLEDLLLRKSLSMLINEKIFKRYIFLDNSKGVGTVKDIVEGNSFTSIGK